MGDEVTPVDDDELLYRRIPESLNWYDASTEKLSPEAFHPNKHRDITGISVSRARYQSLEEAARGTPGKTYYVAVLRAGDLRSKSINVVPQPFVNGGFDLSHAELPDLNAGNRKENATLEYKRILAEELTLRVEGPYLTPEAS